MTRVGDKRSVGPVSVEETHTQVINAFTAAKGLLQMALKRAESGRVGPDTDDGISPILAVSGPP